MNLKLKENILRAFQLTQDIVEHLDEQSLILDLPGLPSNRIAGQLWCVVGARESMIKGIEMGGWQGFSCSLTSPRVKESVLVALKGTQNRLEAIDFSVFSEKQLALGFNLLEHEVQHHGQLIRFVYGNGLTFPESWHVRYTV